METDQKRFWQKVHAPNPDSCWEWEGAITRKGYGAFGVRRGLTVRAHRFAYEQFRGPIPPNHDLDHLCRNRACVNPSHLEAVTRRENLLRGVGLTAIRAAKTHCIHGHPLDESNTGFNAVTGTRFCRACRVRAAA